MSGIAALLDGQHRAGVYRWHGSMRQESDTDQVRQAAEHAGWSLAMLDGWTHPDKSGLLAEVAVALSFPSWFGNNFDALADCLRDVAEPTVLLWDGWGPLASEDDRAFRTALDVFTERAGLPPPFAVLLRGAGPKVDVPSLD